MPITLFNPGLAMTTPGTQNPPPPVGPAITTEGGDAIVTEGGDEIDVEGAE